MSPVYFNTSSVVVTAANIELRLYLMLVLWSGCVLFNIALASYRSVLPSNIFFIMKIFRENLI
jgi:hypothetical protein